MIESFVMGVLVGGVISFAFRPKNPDWTGLHDQLKKERHDHTRELRYYKKLVSELSQENMEFRREREADKVS